MTLARPAEPDRSAYHRAYQAARYERAKAEGLCPQCKLVPAPADSNFCAACVVKKAKRLRAWQRRQRRARGVPTRRCGICREPGHNNRSCSDVALPTCRCGLRLFTKRDQAAGVCGTCPKIDDYAGARREWA